MAPSREEIQSKVVDLIARTFKLDPATVTAEKSFQDDLGADSLETVELVMALEEDFGIERRRRGSGKSSWQAPAGTEA